MGRKGEGEGDEGEKDSPALGGAVTRRPSNDLPSRFEGRW